MSSTITADADKKHTYTSLVLSFYKDLTSIFSHGKIHCSFLHQPYQHMINTLYIPDHVKTPISSTITALRSCQWINSVYVCFCVRPPRCHRLERYRKLVRGFGECWDRVQYCRGAQTPGCHLDMVQPLACFLIMHTYCLAISKVPTTPSGLINASLNGTGTYLKTCFSWIYIGTHPQTQRSVFNLAEAFFPPIHYRIKAQVSYCATECQKNEGDIFTRLIKAVRDRRKSWRHMLST